MCADDTNEWIRSNEALALIVARAGSEKAAVDLLNKHLFQGRLQARTNAFAEQLNFGPLPTEVPQLSDTTVRVRTFPEGSYARVRLGTENEERRMKGLSWIACWEAGVFAAANAPIPLLIKRKASGEFATPLSKRFVFFNVEFLRSEIYKVALTIPALVKRAKPQCGQKKKKWKFGPVLVKLEESILSGEIERFGRLDEYGTQSAIEQHITSALRNGDDVPPETTVRRRAQHIMRQWAEHLATSR